MVLRRRRADPERGDKDDLLRWHKILAKKGISVISAYRGACEFEALGLSRALVAEFFPGMPSRISGIGLRGIQAAQGQAPCVGY